MRLTKTQAYAKGKCLECLETLQSDPDTERGHVEADEAICEFLKSIGFADVATAYEAIDKWCA